MQNIDMLTEKLKIIRSAFNDLNGELIQKIEKSKITGSFSSHAGSYHFDYRDFSKALDSGFVSVELHLLFEYMIYYHYFIYIFKYEMGFINYVGGDKDFDRESYLRDANLNAELLEALFILKKQIIEKLSYFGIDSDILKYDDQNPLITFLQTISNARSYTRIGFHGDVQFIASKVITENNSNQYFDVSILLNKNIFYSNTPQQIINLAFRVEKGIYLFANVPYDDKAETAFYFLFKQDGYAYIIENTKHSFRMQHYRTMSDGTSGDMAWLDMKYDLVRLPFEQVLDFFDKKSDSQDIARPRELDMEVIGQIADCSPHVKIWIYTFIDKCIGFFLKSKDIQESISIATSPEFVIPSVRKEEGIINLPVSYSSSLPTITEEDIRWSADKVGVTKFNSSLEVLLPEVSLKDIPINMSNITSFEHVKKLLIFKKREASADILQDQLREDFKINYNLAIDKMSDFVRDRGNIYLLKALENREYTMRIYTSYPPNEGYDEQGIPIIKDSILYCYEKQRAVDIKHKFNLSGKFSGLPLIRYTDYQYHIPCDICLSKSRYRIILEFLDYLQLKEFYEITDTEEQKVLPPQIKYLSQEHSVDPGNHFLTDIDPLMLVRNPWWLDGLDRTNNWYHSHRKFLSLSIGYHVCGRCLKKHGQEIYKNVQI